MLYAARCMAEGTKLLTETPGALEKVWEFGDRYLSHCLIINLCQRPVYLHFFAAFNQLDIYCGSGHQRGAFRTVVYPSAGIAPGALEKVWEFHRRDK